MRRALIIDMKENWENLQKLTPALLLWYDAHKRALPWRETVTPYRTWVSEIMLQQTRVSAVIPYFTRFMDELPTVGALAEAPEERLFKLWEGLGYYSRARNLQKAAKILVCEYGGALPDTAAELVKLPGIGHYTAAAIASINFAQPLAAVDGNLLRVAARVSGCGEDIMDAKVRRLFQEKLDAVIDRARPGAYNQAMMDLGATVCLPNGAPLCAQCPARSFCEAYRQGLTEFPNVGGNLDASGAEITLAQWGLTAKRIVPAGTAKHVFTHIEWQMKGYFAEVEGDNGAFRWVTRAELDALAFPTAFKAYTEKAKKLF